MSETKSDEVTNGQEYNYRALLSVKTVEFHPAGLAEWLSIDL